MSNFKDKLKLALESAKTVSKNIIDGEQLTVSGEEFAKRMASCQGCEKHIKATNQCGECFCYLALKGKLAGMKCPLGKW